MFHWDLLIKSHNVLKKWMNEHADTASIASRFHTITHVTISDEKLSALYVYILCK